MKSGIAIYALIRALFNDPVGLIGLIIWVIAAAIETAIISAVVALIAKVFFEKDFEEFFGGTFVVVGIIEIILGLISLFA
ncbi:MAG: hypothetical protein U0L54_02360 [Bacteroidales bacterium]|nr:hypothetical protein [Bacteroidales bacterium]